MSVGSFDIKKWFNNVVFLKKIFGVPNQRASLWRVVVCSVGRHHSMCFHW